MITYRQEIDGLRAIAIIPVILFHIGVDWFSGGFLGVDVFFVISGYLITTIIYNEIINNRFNLANFYERRARRILPALFVVIFFVSLWSAFLQSPFSSRDTFQSVFSSVASVSNILFWFESSNYFSVESDYKPLLHTWSLSVEEQYYLIYPLFFLIVWKLRSSLMLCAISAITLVSFLAYIWMNVDSPSGAFYLLPFRMWELGMGCICALILKEWRGRSKSLLLQQLMSALGFVLIVVSIVAFDFMPVIWISMLFATLGTVLIILFANPQTLIARFLGLPVLVGIGLISYSLYLWHQPILAISRYHDLDKVMPFFPGAVIVLTVVLSIITWAFVERKYRKLFSRKAIYIQAVLGIALFLMIGVFGHITKGFHDFKHSMLDENRREFYVDHFSEHHRKLDFEKTLPKLEEVGKKLFVLGDSIAGDLVLTIRANSELRGRLAITRGGLNRNCTHDFLRYVRSKNFKKDKKCLDFDYQSIVDLATDADEIALVFAWDEDNATNAVEMAEYFSREAVKVYIMGAPKFQHISDVSYKFISSKNSLENFSGYIYKRRLENYLSAREIISSGVREFSSERVEFIDSYSFYCVDEKASCELFLDKTPLIHDQHHLTIEGLKAFGYYLSKHGAFIR